MLKGLTITVKAKPRGAKPKPKSKSIFQLHQEQHAQQDDDMVVPAEMDELHPTKAINNDVRNFISQPRQEISLNPSAKTLHSIGTADRPAAVVSKNIDEPISSSSDEPAPDPILPTYNNTTIAPTATSVPPSESEAAKPRPIDVLALSEWSADSLGDELESPPPISAQPSVIISSGRLGDGEAAQDAALSFTVSVKKGNSAGYYPQPIIPLSSRDYYSTGRKKRDKVFKGLQLSSHGMVLAPRGSKMGRNELEAVEVIQEEDEDEGLCEQPAVPQQDADAGEGVSPDPIGYPEVKDDVFAAAPAMMKSPSLTAVHLREPTFSGSRPQSPMNDDISNTPTSSVIAHSASKMARIATHSVAAQVASPVFTLRKQSASPTRTPRSATSSSAAAAAATANTSPSTSRSASNVTPRALAEIRLVGTTVSPKATGESGNVGTPRAATHAEIPITVSTQPPSDTPSASSPIADQVQVSKDIPVGIEDLGDALSLGSSVGLGIVDAIWGTSETPVLPGSAASPVANRATTQSPKRASPHSPPHVPGRSRSPLNQAPNAVHSSNIRSPRARTAMLTPTSQDFLAANAANSNNATNNKPSPVSYIGFEPVQIPVVKQTETPAWGGQAVSLRLTERFTGKHIEGNDWMVGGVGMGTASTGGGFKALSPSRGPVLPSYRLDPAILEQYEDDLRLTRTREADETIHAGDAVTKSGDIPLSSGLKIPTDLPLAGTRYGTIRPNTAGEAIEMAMAGVHEPGGVEPTQRGWLEVSARKGDGNEGALAGRGKHGKISTIYGRPPPAALPSFNPTSHLPPLTLTQHGCTGTAPVPRLLNIALERRDEALRAKRAAEAEAAMTKEIEARKRLALFAQLHLDTPISPASRALGEDGLVVLSPRLEGEDQGEVAAGEIYRPNLASDLNPSTGFYSRMRTSSHLSPGDDSSITSSTTYTGLTIRVAQQLRKYAEAKEWAGIGRIADERLRASLETGTGGLHGGELVNIDWPEAPTMRPSTPNENDGIEGSQVFIQTSLCEDDMDDEDGDEHDGGDGNGGVALSWARFNGVTISKRDSDQQSAVHHDMISPRVSSGSSKIPPKSILKSNVHATQSSDTALHSAASSTAQKPSRTISVHPRATSHHSSAANPTTIGLSSAAHIPNPFLQNTAKSLSARPRSASSYSRQVTWTANTEYVIDGMAEQKDDAPESDVCVSNDTQGGPHSHSSQTRNDGPYTASREVGATAATTAFYPPTAPVTNALPRGKKLALSVANGTSQYPHPMDFNPRSKRWKDRSSRRGHADQAGVDSENSISEIAIGVGSGWAYAATGLGKSAISRDMGLVIGVGEAGLSMANTLSMSQESLLAPSMSEAVVIGGRPPPSRHLVLGGQRQGGQVKF